MNSAERIKELKLEIYKTVVNNNWRLSVITYNGVVFRGGLIRQRELETGEVIITIITDLNQEIDINLKDIKDVGN